MGKPLFHIQPAPNNTNYVTYDIVSDDLNASLEEQGLTPSQVVWKRLDNGQTKTGFSYFYAGPANSNWSFNLEVKVTNNCGTITKIVSVTPPPPAECDGYNIVSTNTSAAMYSVIIDPCLNANQQVQKNSTLNITRETTSVVVTNIQGRIISNSKGNFIDLSKQLPGTYYVTIIKNGKIVHKQTLLKK